MSDEARKGEKKDEASPPKQPSFLDSKTFRLLTLFIYLAGLSGLGMTLACYHLFLWDSKMPPIPDIKTHHHVG